MSARRLQTPAALFLSKERKALVVAILRLFIFRIVYFFFQLRLYIILFYAILVGTRDGDFCIITIATLVYAMISSRHLRILYNSLRKDVKTHIGVVFITCQFYRNINAQNVTDYVSNERLSVVYVLVLNPEFIMKERNIKY